MSYPLKQTVCQSGPWLQRYKLVKSVTGRMVSGRFYSDLSAVYENTLLRVSRYAGNNASGHQPARLSAIYASTCGNCYRKLGQMSTICVHVKFTPSSRIYLVNGATKPVRSLLGDERAEG